jgi:hypothetical protein
MKSVYVCLFVCMSTVVSFSQEIVEEYFTPGGGNSPITLNGGQKCGQRFTATVPFEGIEVNGPTWSVSGEKGMTIRLYEWAGSYDATVAQSPLAESVLEQLNDNDWFPLYAGSSLPPGEYFWETSDPTNINPGAIDPFQIGCWLWNESRYEGGEAYFNGVPYDDVSVTWLRWYGDDQQGTWTPFPVPDTDFASLAQSFSVPWNFQGVSIASPTWNGTGAGYRMSLYTWDTDYDTTVAATPLAQKNITNHSDNARAELVLENPAPSGLYLLVTDNPVRGTGNVGHWGWTNSSWWDDDNVAWADGLEIETFASFDIYVGELTSEPIGKDFASRALTGVATAVHEWSLY